MRIGVDLGGSKIEAVVMDADGSIRLRRRVPTPLGDYPGTLKAIAELVRGLEQQAGCQGLPTGLGTPGSVSPMTGRMQGCNSTWLNDRALREDIEQALGRSVRLANDADCLALSEAHDGAAAAARSVFAVILGTGVGGGIVINGQLLSGPNAISGEWGHNPLPWPQTFDLHAIDCWCGRRGCIETWLSGPALSRDYLAYTDEDCRAETIVQRGHAGEAAATTILSHYADRLARALAVVINMLDPEVIVLGGGLSNIQSLYQQVPARWPRYVFAKAVATRLLPARHGDASGVRGAARLWPVPA